MLHFPAAVLPVVHLPVTVWQLLTHLEAGNLEAVDSSSSNKVMARLKAKTIFNN
jgi:hypothetical protein